MHQLLSKTDSRNWPHCTGPATNNSSPKIGHNTFWSVTLCSKNGWKVSDLQLNLLPIYCFLYHSFPTWEFLVVIFCATYICGSLNFPWKIIREEFVFCLVMLTIKNGWKVWGTAEFAIHQIIFIVIFIRGCPSFTASNFQVENCQNWFTKRRRKKFWRERSCEVKTTTAEAVYLLTTSPSLSTKLNINSHFIKGRCPFSSATQIWSFSSTFALFTLSCLVKFQSSNYRFIAFCIYTI